MAGQPTGLLLRQIRKLVQSPTDVPDDELLRRFTACHDEDAFAALVGRHGRMVLGVCRSVLRQTQDAEDVFQATFLVLARRAHTIRKRGALASWLHGVALRLARKLGSRAARRSACHCADLDQVPARPMDDLTWRELRAALHEELEGLPEKYRLPLLLCHLEGKTQDEAARQLGWTNGRLRRRLIHGRELLRGRLLKRGLAPAVPLLATALSAGEAAALPASLAGSVARSAVLSLAGGAGAATVSTRAAMLAAEGVRSMFLTKLKTVAALCLCVGLFSSGAAVLALQAPAAKPPDAPPVNREEAAQELPPKEKQEQRTRADRFGDPLPPGAIARLGTVRFRDGAGIHAIAYSPDGRFIVSGSSGSSLKPAVRFWDAATGKQLRVLYEDVGQVYTAAVSPDGKLLATAGTEPFFQRPPGAAPQTFVRIWDVRTGKLLKKFAHAEVSIYTVTFSPDSKTLAAGGWDHSIHLWDVASGKEKGRCQGHGRIVESFTFSPDGKTLASAGGEDQTVRLWDAAAVKEIRRLGGFTARVTSVAFSPSGKKLAAGSDDGRVRVFDVSTGRELLALKGKKGLNRVAFSPDGKALASGSAGVIWDASTGKEVVKLQGRNFWTRTLAFSPDGRTLAGSGNWRLRFWDVRTGEEVRRFTSHEKLVWSAAFFPDGKTVASGGVDRTIRVWEATTGKELFQWRSELSSAVTVCSIAVSPDGRLLAARAGDTLHVWDVVEKKELLKVHNPMNWVRAVVFSPDGKTLATGGGLDDNRIRFWDTETWKTYRTIRANEKGGRENRNGVNALAFSPDGKKLISGHGDGTLNLWECATGKNLLSLSGHGPSDPPPTGFRIVSVSALAVSPDGEIFISGSHDGTARMWRIATGKQLLELKEKGGSVHGLALSPDGKTLATAHDDGAVRFWEMLTGKKRWQWQAHPGGVYDVDFSPNGKLLISASSDTTLLTWDVGRVIGPSPPSGEEAARALWDDLADNEAAKAYRAVWALAAAPDVSVPVLHKHLAPVPPADTRRIDRLVSDLDSKRFAERERATAELEQLGELAEPALRAALEGKPSLEMRRRIEKLLKKLQGPVTSVEQLRRLRAVEVLEHVATPKARRLLESLAEGAPAARLTQEAKAALKRLGDRPQK